MPRFGQFELDFRTSEMRKNGVRVRIQAQPLRVLEILLERPNELVTRDGITRIGVTGYSLGGNLALKLAGDYGSAPPAALRAIAAVSPTLEISRCVHALERPVNIIYQWNFTKDLRARMRRKAACWPGVASKSTLK